MFLFFVTFCLTSAKVVGFWIREKKRGCFSMEVIATAGYIRDKGGGKPWNLSQMLSHSRSVARSNEARSPREFRIIQIK